MDSSLELELELTGAGWADLRLRKGNETHEICGLSYLSDVLDDLLRLGIDFATDRGFGAARFFHEPGSTTLFAENGWWEGEAWVSGYRLSAIVGRDFGDDDLGWSSLHKAKREFILEFGSRDELPAAVLLAAERIEAQHGAEGYSNLWTGRLGFPRRALAALRAALAIPAGSGAP